MIQHELRYAMGVGHVPYTCVCGQAAETGGNMIELNYQFYDISGGFVSAPHNLRVVLSSATGDTGAILARGGAAVVACVIGNTRGLVMDKFTADTELASFMVRTVAPGPLTATPTSAESSLSLQITAPAGAYTMYVKIYNQLGVLVNERTVTWV